MKDLIQGYAEKVDDLRGRLMRLRQVPRWIVLRLSALTGLSAGWWVMALCAAVVGAVSAVATVSGIRAYLDRQPVRSVPASIEDE